MAWERRCVDYTPTPRFSRRRTAFFVGEQSTTATTGLHLHGTGMQRALLETVSFDDLSIQEYGSCRCSLGTIGAALAPDWPKQ